MTDGQRKDNKSKGCIIKEANFGGTRNNTYLKEISVNFESVDSTVFSFLMTVILDDIWTGC